MLDIIVIRDFMQIAHFLLRYPHRRGTKFMLKSLKNESMYRTILLYKNPLGYGCTAARWEQEVLKSI